MRKLETSVRNQKDIRETARASGDTALVKSCNERIKAYKAKHTEISNITGIPEEPRRMSKPRMPKTSNNSPIKLTNSGNGGIIHSENEQSPRKHKKSDYSVKWDKIQSDEYKTRLSNIIDNETALSAVETRAKWALNNRDGVNTEELYAINLSNGSEVGRIVDQHLRKKVERTAEFTKKLNEADALGDKILLIHNHPDGLPPSNDDINALINNKNVAGITVGHDGGLYYYTRPNKPIFKSDFVAAVNNYKEFTEITAFEKALEELQKEYGFIFKKI